MSVQKPIYQSSGIGSLHALAKIIGLGQQDLNLFAETASDRYHSFDIEKKDGGLRKITAPNADLKFIQNRINSRIFSNIIYPDYLFGGIKDKDYYKNALRHSGAKLLISLDVKDFYPSLRAASVKKIFQYLCDFSPEVSDVLTRLTTYNGAVPQGACTSSHIANLIFFEAEHALVHNFKQKKITYSRLLDDICLSSKNELSKQKITQNIDLVSRLVGTANCKLKNSKTSIVSKSNPVELMYVTGLWINRGHPRVDANDRDNIRLEVNRCVELSQFSKETSDYHEMHNKVSGKVSKLSYIGHDESVEYRKKLKLILPLYSDSDVYKTRKIVESLSRSTKNSRLSIDYYKQFNQVMYRINVHFRNNHSFALEMKTILRKCRPLIAKEDILNG